MRITITVDFGHKQEWFVEFYNAEGKPARHSANILLADIDSKEAVHKMSDLLSKSHSLAQSLLDVQKAKDALNGEP